ncbi:unnamed protein product [Phytomonas sp. Hart1]|nr:unnamed protein product [Phytomonas sp. Hart1]|eukprot:CCW67046.1 unnamed protein product [Phytomonas sp. isolate Hart1]
MIQRILLLFLLTLVALISTIPLSHARISLLVTVSPPYDPWRCIPDLELELSKKTLHDAAKSAKCDATKKVLARIGAPFIVHTDNPDQMQCLLDLLLFGDLEKGICSSPNPLFHLFPKFGILAGLNQRYGLERLKSFELVALPDAWRISKDPFTPHTTLEAADKFIAALPSVNPPGIIQIKLPASLEGDEKAHPHNFFIPLADISITEGPSSDSRWIHFDYTGPRERFQLQRRIRTKRLDNPQKDPAQEAAVSPLPNHSTWDWESHLEFTKPFSDYQSHKTLKAPKGESTACIKLTRAWRTLREQQALSSDTRMVQLRRLLKSSHCNHEENVEEEDEEKAVIDEKTAETCVNFCQALQETREWGRRTGQLITTAQSFAIFSSLFAGDLTTTTQSSSFSNWWGFGTSPQNDKFDNEAFLIRTKDFIHQQRYKRCPCNVSRAEQGEFLYLAALFQLLQLPGSANTTPQTHITEEYHSLPSARAVVDLYQAMWYESPHATATLATLREHGILTRQHQKAALSLLLRSMRGKSSFIFRQLFRHRKQINSAAMQKTNRSDGFNRDSPVELLLRQERFYAILNTFGNINYPVASRKSIESILSMGDSDPYNPDEFNLGGNADDILSEEENRDVASGREVGHLSARAANQLIKASILMTGPIGVKQDLEEAECILLTILRKFGYLCDMDLLNRMELNKASEKSKHHRSRLYKGICGEHRVELGDLFSNPSRPRISCPSWFQIEHKETTKSITLPVPRAKKNYNTLQRTLMLLSYLYLLKNQEYELVAAYASLSVYLSDAAHKVAYADLRPKVLHQLQELRAAHEATPNGTGSHPPGETRQFDPTKLHRRLQNWGEIKLARGVGHHLPYDAFQSQTPPLALVDSPIAAIGQPMTLLAVCALLDPVDTAPSGPGDFSRGASVTPRVSASMWHVNHLFRHVFQVPFGQSPQETAFLLLLTAMNQWRRTLYEMNLLDQTYLSIHTIDAFVVMSWLVENLTEGDPGVVARAIPGGSSQLHTLSLLALRGYGRLVGRRHTHLPRGDDSTRSYARRVLAFAVANLHGGESAAELLFRGLAAPESWPDGLASRRAVLRLLREGRRRDFDPARLRPLLAARDVDAYVAAANWTWVSWVGDRLGNAVLYLFTETTHEALLRELGLSILTPPWTADPAGRARESPAAFVGKFLDAFAASPGMREMSIATWLLATTLESGEATGFALIFYEAAERRNRFMAPFADYLAQEVWDNATTARMWGEHHRIAQWHREKSRLRGQSTALSLNGHSPFRYNAAESRQEFMAFIDRWSAKRLIQKARMASNSSNGQRRSSRQLLDDAKTILLRCTSQIIYNVAMNRSTTPTYPRDPTEATGGKSGSRCGGNDELKWLENISSTLYDSMLFPAGDPQCALDLYSLLGDMYGNCFTAQMRRNFMTYVVGDLVNRLAYYYNFTANLSSKDVLPLSSTILEDDDLRNKNPLKRGKSGMNSDDDDGEHYGSSLEREFLVEPWNRIGVKLGEEMPISLERGEGMVYNLRLHRLTGIRWGAKAISLWNNLKIWFRWNA